MAGIDRAAAAADADADAASIAQRKARVVGVAWNRRAGGTASLILMIFH